MKKAFLKMNPERLY